MSIAYILRRVKQKTGLDDRTTLLDYINEAARELYSDKDHPGSLEECVLPVYHNTTIALPPFIESPRALREYESTVKWKLSSVRTRYHEQSWPEDSIRNWRDKGTSPLAIDLENTAPPIVTVPEVESSPIVVTIIGATETANRIEETKVIDQLEVQFENSFISYETIKKDRINSYNVSILDADENEISVIYNNELEAMFRIIDVTSYPVSPQDTTNSLLMEVLYKKKLPVLFNDNDEFPIKGYDDVLINKTVQLIAEDQGNIEKAALNDNKAARTASRIAQNFNKGKDVRIDTASHPHDNLFASLRSRARY